MMYTEILQRIPSETYGETRRLLACSLFKRTTYPLLQVCNLMGIKQHRAYAALQNLHSVLDIPPPSLTHERNIKVFHSSFSDFLFDTNRSRNFGIGQAELIEAVGGYWHAYFRILQQAVGHGEPNIFAPFTNLRSVDHWKGISLVWQSVIPEEDKQMRLRLLDEAQNCWTSSFTKLQSVDSSTMGLAGTPNFPVCISISDLLEILGQMYFNKLDEYMPQSNNSVPFDFLDSLRNLCDVCHECMVQWANTQIDS